MPSPFDIQAATNTVELQNNRGTAVFTVRNISGRRIRAISRLVPSDPHVRDWLEIDETEERQTFRDFDIDQTEQYRILVHIPADAAPGRYTFRLLVADDSSPDEDFSESQDIIFTVSEPEEPPTLPVWLIPLIVVILVVLVGTGLIFVVTRPTATETPTPTLTLTPTPSPLPTRTLTPTPSPTAYIGVITIPPWWRTLRPQFDFERINPSVITTLQFQATLEPNLIITLSAGEFEMRDPDIIIPGGQ